MDRVYYDIIGTIVYPIVVPHRDFYPFMDATSDGFFEVTEEEAKEWIEVCEALCASYIRDLK